MQKKIAFFAKYLVMLKKQYLCTRFREGSARVLSVIGRPKGLSVIGRPKGLSVIGRPKGLSDAA